MRVVRSASDLNEGAQDAQPMIVLASPSDPELISQATERLCLRADLAGQLGQLSPSRPSLRIAAGQSTFLAVIANPDASPAFLRVGSSAHGLLVVIEQPGKIAEAVAAAARADETPAAMALLLAEIGRISEENMADLTMRVSDPDARLDGYLSRQGRSRALAMRARLMAVESAFDAQRRFTAEDEGLARLCPGSGRELHAAGLRFGYVSDLAARLYALTGDVLSQQSAIITERLTLVNTIFLPLTLAASFFGMNFAWMTDRIESFRSFIELGVVAPAVLAVLVFLGIRRFVR